MRNLFWISLFLVGLPAAVLLIAHASSKSPALSSIAVQLGVLAVFAGIVWVLSMSNGVSSQSGVARLRAFGLYKYNLPEAALSKPLRTAKDVSDLGDESLSIRTNGVSIPGYHAGWFRTKSNRKAFAAIVDSHAPIAVIRTSDVDVLVSKSLLEHR